MEPIDLLVIGAGIHGLITAKSYAESATSPYTMRIFDSAASIGGVWASERLYPGLKTNNVVGSYEFSDYPMDLKRYKLKPGDHIPGNVVHQYLVDFAKHFNLQVQLRTKVEAATLEDDGVWRVGYSSCHGRTTKKGSLRVRKIAVATGLTSEPHIPTYPGQFNGHFFHASELNLRAPTLRESKGDILVIGANKSAWDASYMAAQLAPSEAKIHMLIRPSGRGPSWVWRRRSGYFSISRLTSTRLFTWFDPTPLASPWQRMFLASWLGRCVSIVFWTLLDYLVLLTTGYIPAKDGLRPLRPWFSTFWMGNSLSVHNYETDWFELAKLGRIVVHHAEISSLDETTARLSNGHVLEQVGTVVACTGWEHRPNIRFTPPIVGSGEGKPLREEDQILSQTSELISGICPAVLRKTGLPTKQHPTPYRLYRFMAPLEPRLCQPGNIAFIGFYQSVHTMLVAQAQALWASVFFRRMVYPAPDMKTWTYLNTEYQQLRRLGSPFPDLVLDALPYIDLLLTDLDLAPSRKGSWWKDLVGVHTPSDYQGLVRQWVAARAAKKTLR